MPVPKTIRWAVSWFFIIGISLEITGYLSRYTNPDLYGSLTSLEAELADPEMPMRYNRFLKNEFSPIMGWAPTPNYTSHSGDCLVRKIWYNHDAYGARIYPRYNAIGSQVMLIGDSFTWGHEVRGSHTISAKLYANTGIMSANLGVAMYDPTQSFLRATSELRYFPNTRAVVLGVMYENIERMVNTYRYVYIRGHETLFRLKPYMKNNSIQQLDTHAYRSLDDLKKAVRIAIEEDYWSKPLHRFPYSLALMKALLSPAFNDTPKRHRFRPNQLEYERLYRNRELGENLLALLLQFHAWAEENHVIPIVTFIPANEKDVTSAQIWIDDYKSRLPSNLVVSNIELPDAVRKQYKPRGGCHPGPEGTEEIARQYGALLEQHVFLLKPFLYRSLYEYVAKSRQQ